MVNLGYDPIRVSRAIDVLEGRAADAELHDEWRPTHDEPFTPTEADWDSYCEWSDRLDRDGWRLGDDADHVTDRDLVAAGLPVG